MSEELEPSPMDDFIDMGVDLVERCEQRAVQAYEDEVIDEEEIDMYAQQLLSWARMGAQLLFVSELGALARSNEQVAEVLDELKDMKEKEKYEEQMRRQRGGSL